MHATPPIRLGIVRPAGASSDTIVAEIEARVLATELARRLGPVLLDLRIDGNAIGRWRPLAHAAWPTAIDALVDVGTLWSSTTCLTAQFARTVEPAAAEVRGRMLTHLGLIPDEAAPLDAMRLAGLRALSITPTDLWLVARAATAVTTGVAEIDAITTPAGAPEVAELDLTFDALAAGITAGSDRTAQGLQQQLDALRTHVAELEASALRDAREAADRFDELAHERAVLRERLERAELDGAGASTR
jgi:hypothetical protein